jgi:hypothetical protein
MTSAPTPTADLAPRKPGDYQVGRGLLWFRRFDGAGHPFLVSACERFTIARYGPPGARKYRLWWRDTDGKVHGGTVYDDPADAKAEALAMLPEEERE